MPRPRRTLRRPARHRRAVAGAAFVLAAAAAPTATAQTPDVVALAANGNALQNTLSFTPQAATASVGQILRWTNTDRLAPHTVTEDHGLFDLVGGNVGATRTTPGGFGPGTTVELPAFAGTVTYYCRVHPGKMSGQIAVPVTLALGPGYKAPRIPPRTKAQKARRAELKRNFQRTLKLTWATAEPVEGQVFDVDVKRGSGPWKPLLARTIDTTITIKSGKRGTTTKVRARLRAEKDVEQSTGWSPDAVATP